MSGASRKILVVALDNLGDAVMASAVLAPLKKFMPGLVIGLWVKRYAAGLFTGDPNVDHLHAADPFWDRSPGVAAGGVRDFYATLQSIRAIGYDTALLLNTEWRRALACRFAGIANRVGYDRRHSRPFLTTALAPAKTIQHFTEDHRALVEKALEVSTGPLTARLSIDAAGAAAFERWRRDSGVAGAYWVAHLFSGDALKNWPVARWLELIAKAAMQWPNRRCVVLLGPTERGRLDAKQLSELEAGATILDAPSLELMKAVLGHAALIVDGDSGPGHVAAALGRPVVSLFGPTHPLRSRPLGGAPARIVSALATADIAVADVWAAMADIKPRV
jgi:ADP-heptose:LPS heptosyltransferase